jgi:tetratricopeptide (TPR) repeat protein
MSGSPIPVAPGMSERREKGLLDGVRVETLPAAGLSERESAEELRKLAALGYLGAREAGGPTGPGAAGRTPRAWNNLGVYLRRSGRDASSARAAFERSIEIDPSYHSPVFNLAEMEKEKGNFPEAVRLLLKAVSLGQPNPDREIERWAADFERRRKGAGMTLFRAAAGALPGNEAIARDLSLALSRGGECREAAASIARFEESRSVETLNVAGLAEQCAGSPDRARLLLQRSLEINPDQPEVAAALSSIRRP